MSELELIELTFEASFSHFSKECQVLIQNTQSFKKCYAYKCYDSYYTQNLLQRQEVCLSIAANSCSVSIARYAFLIS